MTASSAADSDRLPYARGTLDRSEGELPGLPGHRGSRRTGAPARPTEEPSVDHGPEFAGRLLDQWAYLNGVEIEVSRSRNQRTTPISDL